ncbi:hydroxypyruvate isomerase [Aliidongia dinghuensis]|uniref:Hydroxypyruvate isomerase n=1 Tax=Aliidongia dinghuensis TaxID=1867774 RepID=A0A8J3E1T0_9PROT|nr:2-oxo-tetronate isomerase [Aliidongia dinghuensis]GGF02443.1 hydroxypyruvate isomerase [Aliidongia dinghuensis]
MPRFAANLSMMFSEYDFLDRFSAAADAGFKAVEYLFPYEYSAEELARRLESAKLTQALFNLPPGDWAKAERGLAALPGREADFAHALDRAIAYARPLNCAKLHAMAGILPPGTDPAAARRTYVANLRRAAEHAAEAGITILIEPINTRDIPGYFLNRPAEARAIIEEVGAANLRLQFDIYHCQIMVGDLATQLRAHADITGHIQIAGVPDRHEPDVGEINYPYLFNVIDEIGYDGWIGCEYRPRGETADGLGWLDPWR